MEAQQPVVVEAPPVVVEAPPVVVEEAPVLEPAVVAAPVVEVNGVNGHVDKNNNGHHHER